MTSATERHAILVEHGWTCRIDGLWRPPDLHEQRVYTFTAAWDEHLSDVQDVAEQIAEAIDWTDDADPTG